MRPLHACLVCVITALLPHACRPGAAEVVLNRREATSFLSAKTSAQQGQQWQQGQQQHHRNRRAKPIREILEEIRPGSLERECVEETCTMEEVHEITGDTRKTIEFWNKSGRRTCAEDNGGCDHFCLPAEDKGSRKCECAAGYTLAPDGMACNQSVDIPCGKIQVRSPSPVISPSEEASMTEQANHTTVAEPERGPFLTPRITGGQICTKGHCPWQVLLIKGTNKAYCGGTLIHQQWVLTAAHCVSVQEKYPTFVRLGDHYRNKPEPEERTVAVAEIIAHPHFNLRTFYNDIALLRLRHAAGLSPYIVPACLPDPRAAERSLLLPGVRAVVSGWGRTLEQPGLSGSGRQSIGNEEQEVLVEPALPEVSGHSCVESQGGHQVNPEEVVPCDPPAAGNDKNNATSAGFSEEDLARPDGRSANPKIRGQSRPPVRAPPIKPWSPKPASQKPNKPSSSGSGGSGSSSSSSVIAASVLGQSDMSPVLRFARVSLVSHETCINTSRFAVTRDMLCAGPGAPAGSSGGAPQADACDGDSGGPLVAPLVARGRDRTWFVIGLVSWGEGCALPGKYGIYTRVSRYVLWIESSIRAAEAGRVGGSRGA
ncbi:vitamin K-dependent protein C-like isoform X2 [Lampetra fluviatilis]